MAVILQVFASSRCTKAFVNFRTRGLTKQQITIDLLLWRNPDLHGGISLTAPRIAAERALLNLTRRGHVDSVRSESYHPDDLSSGLTDLFGTL
jgi:hypothetical protein